MDPPILARPELVLVNKRIFHQVDFAMQEEYKVQDRQILGPCLRAEKPVEHESDGDTNFSLCPWNKSLRLEKKTRGIGDQRKNQDHPDYSTVKIS